jgi:hypothetical protein
VAINPISARISALPSPPARGRSLPHHGRPLAGHALGQTQGVASPRPHGLARVPGGAKVSEPGQKQAGTSHRVLLKGKKK